MGLPLSQLFPDLLFLSGIACPAVSLRCFFKGPSGKCFVIVEIGHGQVGLGSARKILFCDEDVP